ncbi:MAG: tetratricopeptide repeat protein [Geminicoccaceae bacterium]
MLATDPRGEPLSVGEAASVARLEAALLDVLGFAGDPLGKLDAALAADPELLLGHLLRAEMLLFALQPGFAVKAADSLAAVEARLARATPRERLHLAAARAWAAGDFAAAGRAFDELLAVHPRDLQALMFAHQADFFGGGGDRLRERPRRALEGWDRGLPGHGFVQAMLAFGLEEAGEYATAEELGRAAVAANPKDVWGIHAVGHVLEMQGRDAEGIAWYEAREADWAPGNYFAVHNAWHLALYHVDRADHAAALAVYDRLIRPRPGAILLNLCDATALLWRLDLAGVEVGERWQQVADLMAPHALARVHVFDDVHLAIALAASGHGFAFRELLRSLRELAQGSGEPASMARLVGLPTAQAMAAFAHGAHGVAVERLLAVRPYAALMTGSAAQRDILELTLLEAALRDGQRGLARGLLETRRARKPRSEQIMRDLERCDAGRGA